MTSTQLPPSQPHTPTLYGYPKSSATHRVRIALGLKGLPWHPVLIDMMRNGGDQHSPAYQAVNMQELVPTLVLEGHSLTQSQAILEYLDELYPEPPLLPSDALGRARVRSLGAAFACDLHPLNNLRVLQRLEAQFGMTAEQKYDWMAHWLHTGLGAMEKRLSAEAETGLCCHGDQPGYADCFLAAQVANAARWNVEVSGYPTITRIYAHLMQMPAFQQARAEVQPDYA